MTKFFSKKTDKLTLKKLTLKKKSVFMIVSELYEVSGMLGICPFIVIYAYTPRCTQHSPCSQIGELRIIFLF